VEKRRAREQLGLHGCPGSPREIAERELLEGR
jgi:hypothetical protein